MIRPVIFFIVAVAAFACVNAATKLPEDIKKCNVKESTKNECLQTAIIDGLKKLKNGKKSLGLLSIDPLHVDEVILDLGTGQAPFLFKARNVEVYGLSDSVLKEVDFKPEKFSLVFHSLTPNATFTFDYEATGRILLLPVNGAGPGSFTFTDMDAIQRIEGVPKNKDGHLHMDIKKYEISFDAKKLDIHLDGLFRGNKQISDQLNEFLRTEWRVFLDQLRGPSAEAFGTIFKDITNRVFSRVPYNDVFPGADDLVANKS